MDGAPRSDSSPCWRMERFSPPLRGLPHSEVADHCHDVHFRPGDEIRVYRGLTVVLKIRRKRSGGLKTVAHANYPGLLARELERATDAEQFGLGLGSYLADVEVGGRHTEHEGNIQLQWSRVTEPWIPFDREGRLGFKSASHRREFNGFPMVQRAYAELDNLCNYPAKGGERWARPEIKGSEVDQLAIDTEGRLVLIELKDASKPNREVYYSPFQLLQYVWEWHTALDVVRDDLQCVLDARASAGLVPPGSHLVAAGVRACVGFGRDQRTAKGRSRYEQVLAIANSCLPEGVGPIETWEYGEMGPTLVPQT